MKRLILVLSLLVPQGATAQSDPFMDLTMPDLGTSAGNEKGLKPATTAAQSDPSIELTASSQPSTAGHVAPSPYGCPPQIKPAWEADLSIRDSYKSVLLLNIYEATWIRNVEHDGTCSCSNRVPSWDEADLIYQTIFANLEPADQMNARLKLAEANRLRLREVDKICDKELQ